MIPETVIPVNGSSRAEPEEKETVPYFRIFFERRLVYSRRFENFPALPDTSAGVKAVCPEDAATEYTVLDAAAPEERTVYYQKEIISGLHDSSPDRYRQLMLL